MKKERKRIRAEISFTVYKEPKTKKKSTSWTLIYTNRKYQNQKCKAKGKEREREYEQKYLSRYKQPKPKKNGRSSDLYKPEIPKPKRRHEERTREYEQKYLSRTRNQRQRKMLVLIYTNRKYQNQNEMKKERRNTSRNIFHGTNNQNQE